MLNERSRQNLLAVFILRTSTTSQREEIPLRLVKFQFYYLATYLQVLESEKGGVMMFTHPEDYDNKVMMYVCEIGFFLIPVLAAFLEGWLC